MNLSKCYPSEEPSALVLQFCTFLPESDLIHLAIFSFIYLFIGYRNLIRFVFQMILLFVIALTSPTLTCAVNSLLLASSFPEARLRMLILSLNRYSIK